MESATHAVVVDMALPLRDLVTGFAGPALHEGAPIPLPSSAWLDGIGTDIHDCQATALEDMEVCLLPFDQIESLARRSDQFRHDLHRMLSQESARARRVMIVLGTMRAEQRLAVFLLDLAQQNRAHGYSSCEFVLRMTREEIGSYLGLKLETVSRLFSRFQHEGLIQVQGRAVKLLDRAGVRKLVDCDALRDSDAGIVSRDPLVAKRPPRSRRRAADIEQPHCLASIG